MVHLFLHAQIEEHYIHLLADILIRLKIVYIIVQLEAIEAKNPIPHSQLRAQKSSRRKAARLPNRPLLTLRPK